MEHKKGREALNVYSETAKLFRDTADRCCPGQNYIYVLSAIIEEWAKSKNKGK